MEYNRPQRLALINNPVLACQSETDLLHRRERVAALRNQGRTVREIAAELCVDVATVSRDIKAVCNYYLSRIVQHRNAWMADALSKLDATESEAWAAFRRSTGVATEVTRETSDDGVKRRVTKKNRPGDPRFLAIAVNCQKQRSLLLGLLTKETANEVGRLAVRKPKMLVIKDRQQAGDLIDVSMVVAKVIDAPDDEGGAENEPELM